MPTYGFSAKYRVEFETSLLEEAMLTVAEAFQNLEWQHLASLEHKRIFGSAEPIKESKWDEFARTKVNRFLVPSDYSLMMAVTRDIIDWQFTKLDSKVSAEAYFFIRKTTRLFNKPEQERLSSIIRRMFEQISRLAEDAVMKVTISRSTDSTPPK